THLALGQRSSIQIVLPAINGRTCKAGDPRDHGEAAPACRSHFAGGEQSAAPLVELRADCFPAGPNGIFFDHAIRVTTVRPKSESFRPESLGRTLTECDSVIVRSVLSRTQKCSARRRLRLSHCARVPGRIDVEHAPVALSCLS